MDPSLEILPGDGLPERRALVLASTEQSYRFAVAERVNAFVILRGPLTCETEQLNEQVGTEEPCRGNPSVIECVEQGAEVGARKFCNQKRNPVLRLITLATKQRQVIAQHMRCHTPQRVGGAFRHKLPLISAQPPQQIRQS